MKEQTISESQLCNRIFGWLGGCSPTSLGARLGRMLKELRGPREEVSLDSMQLKVNAKHDGQTLQVRYALTNDTPVDVFVQHLTDHGLPITEPYTYHVRQHEVVLWMGTPPLIQDPRYPPLIVAFAMPPVPRARRLAPGESLDVVLRLALPLVECDLYMRKADPPEPVWADVIRFRLDVQAMRRGLSVSERHGTYWVNGPEPVVIEATTTIDLPIPVHRYGEDFHRAGLAG